MRIAKAKKKIDSRGCCPDLKKIADPWTNQFQDTDDDSDLATTSEEEESEQLQIEKQYGMLMT